MKCVCLEMDTLKKATGKDNNVHLTDCIYVTQGEKIRLWPFYYIFRYL